MRDNEEKVKMNESDKDFILEKNVGAAILINRM
jgi:hypothetical protein